MTDVQRRIYRGQINNGVHTFHNEATEAVLMRMIGMVNTGYDWNYVYRQIGRVGSIATFVKVDGLTPLILGYVTGVLEELDDWVDRSNLRVLNSEAGHGTVPFSNSVGSEQDHYVLSDDEFVDVFGFARPADAISRPDRKFPIDFASSLPPFVKWRERGLYLPEYLGKYYRRTTERTHRVG